jgi:hypothetical protein
MMDQKKLTELVVTNEGLRTKEQQKLVEVKPCGEPKLIGFNEEDFTPRYFSDDTSLREKSFYIAENEFGESVFVQNIYVEREIKKHAPLRANAFVLGKLSEEIENCIDITFYDGVFPIQYYKVLGNVNKEGTINETT